ncbi:MAG: ABC transporter ATP-binding protein [Pseudomonadota bacterium]
MNAPIITVSNLEKSFTGPSGNLKILDNINFSIGERSTVAITGVSGAGKSTLLGLIAGLDTASAGEIEVCGQALAQLDENGRALLRRHRMGFVFQSFHLITSFSALENVLLPMELNGLDDARRKAREALRRVGLEHRLDHYPAQLSGGEQQRVALARAFGTTPQLLLADEPTGNLDKTTASAIIELLFELNAEHQTTLLVVTHDDALASRCERIIEIDGGRMANQGGQ